MLRITVLFVLLFCLAFIQQATLPLGVVLNLLKFYSIYPRESHDPVSNLEKEITPVVP